MQATTPLVPGDLAASLVAAAILAPSSHNTQPWLFRVDGRGIDVLADRTRALQVNDPHDRELGISCGCALFNLRVAAAAAGWQARVSLAADDAEPDRLARVDLVPASQPLPLAGLHPLIDRRRTFRQRFAQAPVDPAALAALHAAVQAEGACLVAFSRPDQRHEVAALVAEGDALQWANPSWRRELAAWMHPRRRGDGLSMPALAVPVAQLVVRRFDMGGGVGAKDSDLADASPLLTVIGTPGDGVADWLGAGQALQHALLAGLSWGLQASYLNQPVQVDALRPRLQALCQGEGVPQLLLRWGRSDAQRPATPRRPLADVMLSTP